MWKYIKCHFCGNTFWGMSEKEDTCKNCLKKTMETIYNFEGVPQEDRYIKVYNLFCQNDTKALCQAKKINSNHDYQILPGKDGTKYVVIKPKKCN